MSTCNKFPVEIRGLIDGLMVGVRWMEEVGERWGWVGLYVGERERVKPAANQARPCVVTNSIETPTPKSDGPVTTCATHSMESSGSLKSTATQLPSFKNLLTNNPQVTRWPVHGRGGSSVK